ncbi:MAG: hypothetical protein Ta2B_00540 [Termitinemataceae bacterium]|nr:MAG: hypothetical protein Ta2B_00540 [Termitinemataceae bacterium]
MTFYRLSIFVLFMMCLQTVTGQESNSQNSWFNDDIPEVIENNQKIESQDPLDNTPITGKVFYDLTFYISNSEVEWLSLDAIRGDGEAAMRLMMHYGLAVHKRSESEYWTIIGAENGLDQAQMAYSDDIWDYRDTDTQKRAIFWLSLSARTGYYYGVQGLKNLGFSTAVLPPDDNLYAYLEQSISLPEISYYKDGALRGSGTAALTLALHYQNMTSAEKEHEFWLRIGAQNGNIECQYNYGLILYMKDDYLNRERGLFWLHRAAKRGSVLAHQKIEQLTTIIHY